MYEIKDLNILRKSHILFYEFMTFRPLMGPISGNVTLPTPVKILLRIPTYQMRTVIVRK